MSKVYRALGETCSTFSSLFHGIIGGTDADRIF
jgi:hypothetical protein